MPDWAVIVPAGAPAPVERARQTVLDVTARLRTERKQLEAARAALTEAEATDRVAMAAAIREGKEPSPDEKTVEIARTRVATCQRRVEAGGLALADAQAALADQVQQQRSKWSDQAQRELEQHRMSGLEALDRLEAALRGLNTSTAVLAWLGSNGGADRGKPAKVDLLPPLRASAAASPNGQPRSACEVLAWLRAALDPPTPAESPGHQRSAWPAPGIAAIG